MRTPAPVPPEYSSRLILLHISRGRGQRWSHVQMVGNPARSAEVSPARPARSSARESSPSPTAGGAQAPLSQSPVHRRRSGVLSISFSDVGRLARSSSRRPAGDGRAMASARFSLLLVVEKPSPRAPRGRPFNSRPDRTDVPGQSAVRCASNTWRTFETWDQCLGGHGLQVHDSPAWPAVSDVANVSRKPCQGPHRA